MKVTSHDAENPSPSIALLDKAFALPWDSQLPLHAKVRRGLSHAIEHFFEDGQRFFTEKELIAYLKVSQVTVRRAVYDLVRDGLLQRRVAKGSFVQKRSKVVTNKSLKIAVHLVDWDSSFLSALCFVKSYTSAIPKNWKRKSSIHASLETCSGWKGRFGIRRESLAQFWFRLLQTWPWNYVDVMKVPGNRLSPSTQGCQAKALILSAPIMPPRQLSVSII